MMEGSNPGAPIVYVVDDEAAVARTIARTIRAGGFDPRTFASPAQFLDALEDLEPGLVCLDVKMPGMNGIELLKILSKKRPEWPVIMLTGHAEVGSTIEAFRSGAIHFLRKPFQKNILLEALEEAAEVAKSRQSLKVDEKRLAALQRLTSREREILNEIAAGLHSKEIAWKLGISIRTVDVHRSNILSKLSAKNTSQAVAIARTASSRLAG